ncbi:transient receptor potential cation channel subfamily A member 1-like [Anneissia japonica]|uniref:transient receptor potential cation channel subfamily A member 1-like n=1 Tax=Anneissia japonica TaxID=1529436 RepID=UPI00142591A6|nr:transient receptor potential cation channel subfamily A member 1-like [Anneissia japonica]
MSHFVLTGVVDNQIRRDEHVDAICDGLRSMEVTFTDAKNEHKRIAATGNVSELLSINMSSPERLKTKDNTGATLLHTAAANGKKDVLEMLLKHEDINVQDNNGNTPLHLAVINNHIHLIDVLLREGQNASILNDLQMAPLHLACDLDNTDAIRALCQHPNVDINQQAEFGKTALHVCAQKDRLAAAITLLDFKPMMCIKDSNGAFSVHCAATNGSKNVLGILLEKAEKCGYSRNILFSFTDKEGNTALHAAVNSGSQRAVEVCIEQGSPINFQQSDQSTALHLASSQGCVEIVKLILDKDDECQVLEMRDIEGMTALHRASAFDHIGIVKLLLKKGASIDIKDCEGRTPLMLAASRGSWRTVNALISMNADYQLRDIGDRNFLHHAVYNGFSLQLIRSDFSTRIVELLNDADERGCTPMHYATQHGNFRCVEHLLKLGATANLKNRDKQAPLHFAARFGRLNTLRRLLDCPTGLNLINEADGEGMTALHIAAWNGHVKVVQMLINQGALLHRDHNGRSPLHLAAMGGYTDTMNVLLSTNSHLLNQTDDFDNTALHLSAMSGQSASVSFLLSQKADVLPNSDGDYVIDVAIENKFKDVSLALVNHERWKEVMANYNHSKKTPMHGFIEVLPAVAKSVLDKCLTHAESVDPKHTNFWVKYDFEFLQYDAEYWHNNSATLMPLAGLNLSGMQHTTIALIALFAIINMVKEVVQMWNQRWKYFSDINNLTEWSLYVFLSLFAIPQAFRVHFDEHVEWACGASAVFLAWFGALMMLQSAGVVKIGVTVIKFNEDIEKGDLAVTLFNSELNANCESCSTRDVSQNIICYRFNVSGIFVLMFIEITKTMVQVLMVFSMLIIAFGLAFYLLLKQEDNHAFRSPGISLFRVLAMMLGEIDSINSFISPATDESKFTLHFPAMTFTMLTCFIIFMPILLMNLLIGLAVGDIAGIQRNAQLKRLAMQVESHTDMEAKMPLRFLKWIEKKEYVIYPNQICRVSSLFQTFDRIVGTTQNNSQHTMYHDEIPDSTALEVNKIKTRLKYMCNTLEKQSELLKLIVQRMEITTESEEMDEGEKPSTELRRYNMSQVVRLTMARREKQK